MSEGFAAPPVALRLRDLTRDFGELRAVDGLTLEVPPGELFALVGPDGAGKTTAIRMIGGAIRVSTGDAEIFGVSVVRQPDRVKRQIGYMSQRFSLYGELSVRENLRFFANLHGVAGAERETRGDELLVMTRLSEFQGRRAEQLSGGMKQKLALACTLVHTPRLLLLDEPTTGVDPVSRREFWRILHRLKHKNVTVVVSTPYMDEAERCDRVGFLHQGKLLRVAAPEALTGSLPYQVLRLQTTQASLAMKLVRNLPGIHSVQMFGDRLHLLTSDPARVRAPVLAALARGGILEQALTAGELTLEDAFVALTEPKTDAGRAAGAA